MTEPISGAEDRANVLVDLGRYHEAADVARSALAVDPNNANMALLLAMALCEGSASPSDAVTAAKRAVALQPAGAMAHCVLGWAVFLSGRPAEAADHLAHALSIDPDDADIHVRRSEVLLRQVPRWRFPGHRRRDLLAEAEQHADAAIRLQPAEPASHLAQATVALSRRDPSAAEQWIRSALSLRPDHPAAHELLGLAAEMRGDTRSASAHYLDSGKLDPSSDRAIEQLRTMRTKLPAGFFVAIASLGIVRLTVHRLHGTALLVVSLLVVLVMGLYLCYLVLWKLRQVAMPMSQEARHALARHARLHRHPR